VGPRALRLGVIAALLATLWSARASAFGLVGHEIIEAAAYKRLLAVNAVPGTTPPVSGRTVLATLIAQHVLLPPPCFDPAHPGGDCDEAGRLDLPLRFLPVLGAGAPDLVIDRQLGQRGQCQHFMARTDDDTSPPDPRFGVPRDLVTAAYERCVRLAGVAFDGILTDPHLAAWRLVGAYALIHAVEDSFSAAHVERDADFKIVHLLSWTLIDWPYLVLHGRPRTGFPPATHHAATDRRDYEYLRAGARGPDGRACDAYLQPYAVPEVCLTPRALAAVGAVVDFLVLTYRLRTGPDGRPRPASLFSGSDEARVGWQGYLDEHFNSVAAKAEVPHERFTTALPRADTFLGVHGGVGDDAWSTGLWAAWLGFVRPVVPCALVSTGGVLYARDHGVGSLLAVSSLGLALPLVRRFTLGASPLGVAVACDTHVSDCSVDLIAGVGTLLIPLGDSAWLGFGGPRYSWTDRSWGNNWFGVEVGWSHEHVSAPRAFDPAAVAAWNPPRPDEIHAYRSSRATRSLQVVAAIASRDDDAYFGGSIGLRRDRDGWNRRSGLGPELELALYHGRIDATKSSGGVWVAPQVRYYLVPDQVSVVATPALVRAGALGSGEIGFDVGARGGLSLQLGNVELGVDSAPLSYLSSGLRHALPIAVRVGALLD
jgi:hypothetical protein